MLGGMRFVEAVQEPVEVRVWGDEAYEWGSSRYAFAAPASRRSAKREVPHIWRRQPDGTWRVHRDASTATRRRRAPRSSALTYAPPIAA
jgi:ketosteroid isomerase-like protein